MGFAVDSVADLGHVASMNVKAYQKGLTPSKPAAAAVKKQETKVQKQTVRTELVVTKTPVKVPEWQEQRGGKSSNVDPSERSVSQRVAIFKQAAVDATPKSKDATAMYKTPEVPRQAPRAASQPPKPSQSAVGAAARVAHSSGPASSTPRGASSLLAAIRAEKQPDSGISSHASSRHGSTASNRNTDSDDSFDEPPVNAKRDSYSSEQSESEYAETMDSEGSYSEEDSRYSESTQGDETTQDDYTSQDNQSEGYTTDTLSEANYQPYYVMKQQSSENTDSSDTSYLQPPTKPQQSVKFADAYRSPSKSSGSGSNSSQRRGNYYNPMASSQESIADEDEESESEDEEEGGAVDDLLDEALSDTEEESTFKAPPRQVAPPRRQPQQAGCSREEEKQLAHSLSFYRKQ